MVATRPSQFRPIADASPSVRLPPLWGGNDMRMHLPKPLHGWREFIGEVGIIVLGVLIALGFQQGAEAWQSADERGQMVEALSSETAEMAVNATERIALEKCNEARLAELASRLTQAKGEWQADVLPLSPFAVRTALPSVYRIPHRSMVTDNWETAKATGRLNLLSRQQRDVFANLYALATIYRQLEDEEVGLAPQLNILGFDGSLDNVSRLEALRTVARLDYLNGGITLASRQLVDRISKAHLTFDRTQASAELTARLDKIRSVRGACVANLTIAF